MYFCISMLFPSRIISLHHKELTLFLAIKSVDDRFLKVFVCRGMSLENVFGNLMFWRIFLLVTEFFVDRLSFLSVVV
jgi:hypothetical protein